MADSKDYKEKIRKLLRLAESDNENEARSALLKARALMAEHKLSEEEIADAGRRGVSRLLAPVTFSKRRDSWVADLSGVIGENYCCQAFRLRKKGKQTNSCGFIGLDDDAEICLAVFNYAYQCIKAGEKRIWDRWSGISSDLISRQYIQQMAVSYCYGFVNGISEAFEWQKQLHRGDRKWELALVKPKEVEEAVKAENFTKENFNPKAARRLYAEEYQEGYADGKEFDPTHRVDADAEAVPSIG